ncbi:hypothetical protein OGAPHI_000314 [Ogataea philodendri]|uniref:ACB domain-containing protein n=1 Tax=Ogataea philodendri TaxID=1378263 RepID=A0A9P8TA82_9ASCO|nr:uncharacterized protein OGAPHI_000314 [Ogataea philodendri]KAH3671611.1 hypothetical protein OGAPHI_000314 [Ogataea philodendri]
MVEHKPVQLNGRRGKILKLVAVHPGINSVWIGRSVRKHGEDIWRPERVSVGRLVENRVEIDRVLFPALGDGTDILAASVQNMAKRPNDDELLQLYGLYKQATVGDNTTDKPGVFDFKGKYKWEAWKNLEGTSQEDAEKKYISLVDELLAKYN